MIFVLLAALIVLHFVRSTRVLAGIIGFLFIVVAALLYQRNDTSDYLSGLSLALILSLIVAFLMGRIPEAIDRLRTRKG